jgi:hypothetical protein
VLNRIKDRIIFRKVPRGQAIKLEHVHLIMIDGKVEIEDKDCGPGHYKLPYNV